MNNMVFHIRDKHEDWSVFTVRSQEKEMRRAMTLSIRVAAALGTVLLLIGFRPATAEAESRLRDPLDLQQLLRRARKANPDILAAASRLEAASARPSPARTVPNPRVDLILRNTVADGITIGEDPSANAGIGFVQELPYPGKLALRGEVEEKGVLRQRELLRLTELRVLSGLKAAYYELSFLEESISIVRENRQILQKFEKTAEARYEVGKGIQQDVLRAQVEVSRLLETLTTLDQRRGSVKALINQILNRPSDAELGDPQRIDRVRLEYTYEDLVEDARTASPELNAQRRTVEQDQKALELAEREFYPDFVVGGTYLDRGGFDPIYQLTLGLKIPLYFARKERFLVREANSRLAASLHSQRSVQESIEARLRDQYLIAKSSDENAGLYERGLLRQAELALESSISAYEVGTVDFLTLLDNILRLLNDEVQYYRFVTTIAISLARMEPEVNRELIAETHGGGKP